ncbi:MAG: hypothetical protein ACEPOZ_11510 [Marinifilaceae bacterium]
MDIGLTAVSFYLRGSDIIMGTGNAGRIVRTILFVKGFSDLIINANNQEVERILGREFIKVYKDVSNIIDCGLIFKQFANKEINQKVLMLSKVWGGISSNQKIRLKNNYPDKFNFLQKKLTEIANV